MFIPGDSPKISFPVPKMEESSPRYSCMDGCKAYVREGIPTPPKHPYKLELPPHAVTVTTRIIPFLVGNPYKPSFGTVTGRGDNPTYKVLGTSILGTERNSW